MSQFWKWVKDEVSTDKSELVLDGVIASESWWGDEVTPQLFRDELNKHTGSVTVRINSPGGDVFAGVAIYNALREHDGEVTVKVDGLAASIASLIAMAGDKIIMLPGSMMMVHRPWTMAVGNSDDLTQVAEMLEKTCDSMIPIYTSRTGQSEEKIVELLKAETWMTAVEAVELGFATEAVEAKTSISDSIKNAMSYASTVQSAVMQPVMSLKAKQPPKAETPTEVEEPNVPDTTETTPEVVATPTTDDSEVEKTDEEEVTEPTPDNTNNPVEETIMNTETTTEVAKSQVIEPSNQAPVNALATPQAYLKSPASVEAFAEVLRANAGKTFEDVRSSWKDVLVKNGLTDADYFALPEPVITSIEDAVKTSGIYNALNHTGLDVFKVVWDDTDENADTSRAGGHSKGDTKAEQVLDFEKRVIRASYIYKYLVLDKETIRENRSTGALVRFVLNELPTRVLREIERAVIIGDGRLEADARHIGSFLSVKADAAANAGAGNIFATTYIPADGESRYDTLIKAADLLEAEGPVYIVSKKGYLTDLKLERVNGQLVFPAGTNVSDAMGYAGEFKPTWLNDTTDPENDAYLVVLNGYKTVGDNSVESFTNFKLQTNENEFLQEIYKGGALSVRRAAVAIAKPAAPVA